MRSYMDTDNRQLRAARRATDRSCRAFFTPLRPGPFEPVHQSSPVSGPGLAIRADRHVTLTPCGPPSPSVRS